MCEKAAAAWRIGVSREESITIVGRPPGPAIGETTQRFSDKRRT
jgi:hypothetical protein